MDAIVVSTGRCGSTALARALGATPDVVVLNEFFTALLPGAFPASPIDGETLAVVLGRPRRLLTTLLAAGAEPAEFRFDLAGVDRSAGVAPLLAVCLPVLFGADAESAHRELLAWAAQQPPRPIERHYSALCELLRSWLGREFVIERSGGSSAYAAELVRRFPNARYIHLFRDGAETVRSMAEHTVYRQVVGSRGARSSSAFLSSLDADAREDYQLDGPSPALARHAHSWSLMMIEAARALRGVPHDQVVHVSYADLLTDAHKALRDLARFLDRRVDDAAVRAAAACIDGQSRSPREPFMDEKTQRALARGEKVARDVSGVRT